MFNGRRLVIATKHSKESVIATPLEEALGVKCFTHSGFDTDVFGTFSGEVPRGADSLETARAKCMAAMEATGSDLAVASEGSFGPHPIYFFASADEELLLFMDRKNGIEIFARELSTETNFNGKEVSSMEELEAFSLLVNFPSHALILRDAMHGTQAIVKGIVDSITLRDVFYSIIRQHKSVYVETDMRAMYNPTRMKVIHAANQKLLRKILSLCPDCAWPGFDVTDYKLGLPCSDCGNPTQSILSVLYSCKSCGFEREQKYPKERRTEEPRFCDFCNP